MNEEDAMWFMLERQNCYLDKLIETGAQPWKLIKAEKLKREWIYNYHTGHVHDKVIQEFEDICVDNVAKLLVNSIIHGAWPMSAYEYFKDYLPDDSWTKDKFDGLMESIDFYDEKGNIRYTDFACDALYERAIDILVEVVPEKKLYLIDNLLSVTHMSTDLSAWFVEGGDITLNELRDWREDAALLREADCEQVAR